MRFTAVIEQSGRTATGFEVSGEVVESLGAGRRPKVTVTINGKTYRSSVASTGGRGVCARLPYSHQRAHVDAIAEAKKPETRRRRIDRAVEMLTKGKPAG